MQGWQPVLKTKRGPEIESMLLSPVPAVWEAGNLCPSSMKPMGKDVPTGVSSAPAPPFFLKLRPRHRGLQCLHPPICHSAQVHCPPTKKPAPYQAREPSNQQEGQGPCPRELTG